MIRVVFIFFTLASLQLNAQNVVSEDEFIRQVLLNHPISKQADLALEIGENELLKAKGWFDPSIEVGCNQKTFDGKNYYRILDNQVEIPTWIGLDVKFNYSLNNGDFLNPENNLPSNGLWSLGVELPILQGLVFDKRRADLQKGKNYVEMSKLEKQQILNELIFEATKAYWSWYLAYQRRQIAQEGISFAQTTFAAVRSSYLLGDKPAIDTLESLIQIQNRELEFADRELEYQNAKLWVSSFLWSDDLNSVKIRDEAIPVDSSNAYARFEKVLNSLEEQSYNLALQNPKIQQYQYKISNLEIEKRLNREMLKPQLSLGYNFINRPFYETVFDQFNISNYTWNLNFTMPLIYRKERGNLNILKAQLESAEYGFENAKLEQSVKIETIFNKISTLQEQLALSNKNILDNRNLVEAEKRKFDIGESSLFLVNYRETNFLKNLQKQAEIETKLIIAISEFYLEWGSNELD